MREFTINGREFRAARGTINGAAGIALYEWREGRAILHDYGMASHAEATTLAREIAR